MLSDQKKNPVLVACVVIKNDTQHIKSLISSLAPHVDGIVVRDNSDSYTATVNSKLFESTCEHFGIEELIYLGNSPMSDKLAAKHDDNMAECKNRLIDMAFKNLNAQYVLVIDADEEFYYTGTYDIRNILDNPDVCPVFEIPVIGLHTLPGDKQGAYQTYKNRQPRIISCKSTDRYMYPYHEVLTKNDERSTLQAVIYHNGYKISKKDAMTKCHERVKRMLKNDCMGMEPSRYIELIGTTLDAAGYTELGEVFLSVVGKGKEKKSFIEGESWSNEEIAKILNADEPATPRVRVELDPRIAIKMPDTFFGKMWVPATSGQGRPPLPKDFDSANEELRRLRSRIDNGAVSGCFKPDMSFAELVTSLMDKIETLVKKQ